MATLRKFVCYRKISKKPYTRYSKFKKLSYVRSRPVCRVVRFDMGDPRKKYNVAIHLISTQRIQIRDNAIESARQVCTRYLEKNLGKVGFFFQVRIYPHHVYRENPLAVGAGADRMSTGMAHSFGKPIGVAARIKVGQQILTIHVMKEHAEAAKNALKLANHKLPCKGRVIEEKIEVKK